MSGEAARLTRRRQSCPPLLLTGDRNCLHRYHILLCERGHICPWGGTTLAACTNANKAGAVPPANPKKLTEARRSLVKAGRLKATRQQAHDKALEKAPAWPIS
jgi:hypothetical protein